jgi:hypothetical protein
MKNLKQHKLSLELACHEYRTEQFTGESTCQTKNFRALQSINIY